MAAVLYRHAGRPASAFIASTALRWWPPMFALRSFPLMATANPPIHRRFRFSHRPWSIVTVSRLQDNESDKPCRRLLTSPGKTIVVLQGAHHSTITQDMMNFNTDDSKEVGHIENKGAISLVDDEYEMQSEKDTCRKTLRVIFGKHGAATPPPTNSLNPKQVGVDSLLLKKYNEWGQDINLTSSEEDQRSATKDHMVDIAVSNEEEYIRETVIPESRHSDGSIYRDMDIWWKRDFRIADRNETPVKVNPSECDMVDGSCINHGPCSMLQIFSIELAKLRVDGGLVELYGYVAVRDDLDPLLNYVVNISRDDPITLKEGSVIEMVGPKRGIYMMDYTLLEYEMRIKIGEQEKDDLPLIDGASMVSRGSIWQMPYRFHIFSYRGAVDITLSSIHFAFEAAIEVHISEVQSRFSLSLGCLTSGFNEQISLFDGTIAESCGLKRYVVAVKMDSMIRLKFKLGTIQSSFDQHCCSFKAKMHGHDTQEIKTDFGLIMVKLTWSTLD